MKQKILSLFMLVILIIFISACHTGKKDIETAKSQDVKTNTQIGDIDKKVEEVLSQMTLQEKVGQVSQVDIHYLMKKQWEKGGLDPKRLEEVIVKYNIGSILSGGGGSPDNNTPIEWVKMVNEIQSYTEKTRLKIPIIYGVDAVHGHNNLKGSVIYPHNLGVAATWNPELASKSASLTANELYASGIRWNFAPVLDVSMDPRWGRTYETFGEDTYLVSVMGRSIIEGIQESGKVAASAKHFLSYGAANNGQDRQSTDFSDRTLQEIFLPPFREAVKAGAKTVMINSGDVNGVPVHSSKELMTDLLKEELGFEGFIISDWEDVRKLEYYHKLVPSLEEALTVSFNAGLDMTMIPMSIDDIKTLEELVKSGKILEERLDDAVRKILKVKYEIGLFEDKYGDENKAAELAGNEESINTAKQMALESLTLLKNENNILPITKEKKNILIVGPVADSKRMLCGGWTIGWQGADEKDLVLGETILQVVKKKEGINVIYVPNYEDEEKVREAAKKADMAIAALGEEPYAEYEGDTESLDIAIEQQKLLHILEEEKIPTAVVLVSGRPLTIEWASKNMDAILWAYLPGTEGGSAIIDTLFGDYNPGGRLPITIPKNIGQLPITYNSRQTSNYDPLYPFGHGLSYTKFQYSKISIPDKVSAGDNLRVSLNLKNIGEYAGDEVVLLYFNEMYTEVIPRRKQLAAFSRIHLEKGEEKKVELGISQEQLKILGHDMKWMNKERDIQIQIGDIKKVVHITK